MTSIAHTAPDRDDPSLIPPTSEVRSEGLRPALLEAAILAVVVAVAVGITAVIAARSSWYSDDFIILMDAAGGEYTPGYLSGAAIVHFSPGHRLVSLLLYRHAALDHDVALGFLLVVQAVGIVLVQRIVRWWAGPAWWAYAVALAFGLSPIVFSSVEWFSAGLLVLPPTVLSLAAIHAYLHWYRSRRTAWLAWSLIAFAGALLFYEKAILLPVELVLIRVLLLDDGRPIRDGLRTLRDERRVWLPYAVVGVVWFVLFRTRPYAAQYAAAPLGEDLEFLRIAWLESLVPGALGLRVTGNEDAALRVVQVVAAQAVVVAAVIASVRRRHGGWRPWALLAIVFVLSNVLLFPRVVEWGPEAGHTLRYQIDVLLMVPVVLGAAFGARSSVPRHARRGGVSSALALAGTAAALVVAGTASASALSDASPGPRAERWLANLRGDIARLRPGAATLNVLDDRVPPRMLPAFVRSGSEFLSKIVPVFEQGLTFDQAVDPTYRVRADGHLERVRFRRYAGFAGGDPRRLMRMGRIRSTGAEARVTARGLCITAPRTAFSSLELAPATGLSGRRWYLRATYVTGGSGLLMAVNRGVPYPRRPDRGLPGARVATTRLSDLGALPSGPPAFGGLRLDVPPGITACFTALEVGAFLPAGA